MIAVDTSALAAILFAEDDAEAFSNSILLSGRACIAAPTALEFVTIVYGRKGSQGADQAKAFLTLDPLEIVPFDFSHFQYAAKAFQQYGKGTGHPAQLNFGDCISYALAKTLNAPLLFKGGDFARTDIVSAV